MMVQFRQRIVGLEQRKDLDVVMIVVDRYRDKFLWERIMSCYKKDDLFEFEIPDGEK